MFFCDHCKDLIAVQRLTFGAVEERHLLIMGYEEWCINCVSKYHTEVLQSPNVNDTAYEHGEKVKKWFCGNCDRHKFELLASPFGANDGIPPCNQCLTPMVYGKPI